MNDDGVAAPDAPLPAAAGSSLDALIDRWWADHFPGSAVARVTSAWNAAYAAKEALKRLLACATAQASSREQGSHEEYVTCS